MYYLQSRYYAPAIGRFISADAYAMTYETPVGANMFAYCMNNPVMEIDPCGHSPKDWVKNIVNNYLDPFAETVKQTYSKIIPGTIAIGKFVSFVPLLYIGVSEGFAIDQSGNVCEFLTITGGTGTPSVGGSVFASVTNSPKVDYLEKWSQQVGGSCPIGGYEKIFMINNNSPSGYYHGSTFSFGPECGPFPAELHVTQSYTFIKKTHNIFAPYDVFSTMIKQW